MPEIEDFPDFFANKAGVLLEGGDDLFGSERIYQTESAMQKHYRKGLNRMKEALKENQVCR